MPTKLTLLNILISLTMLGHTPVSFAISDKEIITKLSSPENSTVDIADTDETITGHRS